MAKISLGMIVRNEGRTLRACLESVAPHVDQIVIGLGGESTDDTEQIAREFTQDIIHLTWNDDFSEARNIVLGEVTGDWFLWLDGDDILIGGEHLRALAERPGDVNAFYMGYDYGRDEHEQTICYLIRERLVKLMPELPNRGWRWVNPVHEVLVADFPQAVAKVDHIVVQHHKPAGKHAPTRNLDILYAQLAEQEPKPDGRILVYLGNELAGRGMYQEAIAHWNRFMATSEWSEEQYQTQHKIADVFRVMGRFDDAIAADTKAVAMLPEWPDAYFGLAETYYHLGNPKATIEYTKIGSSKERPETGLIINPLDYSYYPAVILSLAHTAVGDYENALVMVKQAYALKQEPTLAKQMTALADEIDRQQLRKHFLALREHLGRNDQWMLARRLFDIVPKALQDDPEIQAAWARTDEQTAHIEDHGRMVDFYGVNPHWEPMDEARIQDRRWLEYPRMKFALQVAKRVHAQTIMDWGCSDGFMSLPLAREGYNVEGFDLDPRCVALGEERAARWGVLARFLQADVEDYTMQLAPGEQPADLALLFEVLEHVVDPARTLDTIERIASHIAITTPYMAWEGGRHPLWDEVEPKSHLRIFDERDMEVLLTGRGQIMNLYRQPFGDAAWIFADYRVGIKTDKNIVVVAPGTLEKWNPRKWAREGMGGSETAIVKLTEAWAVAGHRTFVYGQIDEPGYYDGVCYRSTEMYNPHVKADLVIAWRTPELVDEPINATNIVLWMHDVDAGDRLTRDRAARFTAIVALSNWHRDHLLSVYPFLDPDKIHVIGNGVDLWRFIDTQPPVERKAKKVIYPSSPDRGLDVILEHIWPKVIEHVPDAELHLYYGWNNLDRMSAAIPQLRDFKARVMAAADNLPGIVWHGRVPQDQLAREFLEASVWLYPTYFHETFCITALEAQLAGAIPITNHLAALAETVYSGIVINGDVRTPEVQEQFIRATIDTLLTPLEERRSFHDAVIDSVRVHTWTEISIQWLRELGMYPHAEPMELGSSEVLSIDEFRELLSSTGAGEDEASSPLEPEVVSSND